jgi:Uncharacterised protein family (UPF0014)
VRVRRPGKEKVEYLLALGATRWEATKGVLQRSMRVAMTPVLNQMNVVGIVSIPGMMTGQILGGSDPSQVMRGPTQHACLHVCISVCLPASQRLWCSQNVPPLCSAPGGGAISGSRFPCSGQF